VSQALRSPLGPKIAAYLTLKKALGRRFAAETDVLAHLDRFLVRHRIRALSPRAFTAWSMTLDHLTPTVRRNRMRIVRNFCLYLRRSDRDHFVPDPAGFPAHQAPKRPHIFSEAQIAKLLRVATSLPPWTTSLLRAAVSRIAIVLLYTAGLRRGELVRLAISDYDATEKTLLVRQSKFHKSRVVALSRSSAAEMERYLRARRRFPHDSDAPLLVTNHGGPKAYSGAGLGRAMHYLFQIADIRTSTGAFPRTHDLRHTHAVHVLLRWYRAGVDVQAKLPALAIAMGHVSIASTAYYLAFLEPVASRDTAARSSQPREMGGERQAKLACSHAARVLRRPPAKGPRHEPAHRMQLS
jgi:integrase